MGKGNRQRQLARQRAMRQAARREELRRRRRRQSLITAGVLVTVLALVGGLALSGIFDPGKKTKGANGGATVTPSGTPSASAAAFKGTCTYTAKSTEQTGAKKPGLPPKKAAYSKPVQVHFQTSRGGLDVTLDATKAPCTTNAIAYLISKKFYDGTTCHRVTTTPGLTVLQCGDPTGTGAGGPGFTFNDEALTGATYKRGTVAMANSGPNTNGSQLFFVDKDSTLPPSYTPVGQITLGLSNLDKIIKVGTSATNGDGKPKVPVTITTATITAT